MRYFFEESFTEPAVLTWCLNLVFEVFSYGFAFVFICTFFEMWSEQSTEAAVAEMMFLEDLAEFFSEEPYLEEPLSELEPWLVNPFLIILPDQFTRTLMGTRIRTPIPFIMEGEATEDTEVMEVMEEVAMEEVGTVEVISAEVIIVRFFSSFC